MRIKTIWICIIVLILQRSLSGQVPVESLNLKQLIDSALQHNYLLQANKKQTAVKQSEIELLRLTYQPTISSNLTASFWKFLLPNKQRLLGTSLTDVYTDISVYQTIYDWGENKVKKAAVGEEVMISREIERQLRSTIILGVTDSYFEMLKSGSEIKVHQNTLAQLRSYLKYAEALYDIGKVSEMDVLRINVRISVEEKAIQKAENAFLTHEIKLRRLSFIDDKRRSIIENLTDSLYNAKHASIFNADSLYNITLNNHPSLVASNLKINLEEKQKEISRLQNRPELYSYGIGTWEHGSIPFFNNFNYNIGVGVHYTIPFLGGSGYKTKMVQSDLRVDQITDERTQLFYDLKREIDVTLNEIEDLKTEISNNLKIIKLSRIALDNASVIYQGGQGTIIDVLDAETILSETTINYQKSTIAFLQALSKLSYLTGNDVNTY